MLLTYIYNMFAGRLNRGHYFGAYIIALILNSTLFAIAYSLLPVFPSINPFYIYLLPTCISVASNYGPAIRRVHDIGYDGFVTFIFFLIPLVNVFFLFWLFFKKGNETENRYGPVDSKGDALKKIFGIRKTFGEKPY